MSSERLQPIIFLSEKTQKGAKCKINATFKSKKKKYIIVNQCYHMYIVTEQKVH